MKDPQEAIRSAYYQLLSGSVLMGSTVPVFSYVVPANAGTPYILLSQQTVTDRQTGSCPSAETTIMVEVVTSYNSQAVKASDVDKIAKQVLEITKELKTGTNYMEEFQIAQHHLEFSTTIPEDTGAKIYMRRLLRFRDIVFETN